MKIPRSLALAGLSLLVMPSADAQEERSSPPVAPSQEQLRIQRLEMLSHVWGRLALFHAYTAVKDIDWNRTLVTAIPAVEQARTPEELVQALNRTLFEPIGDPQAFARRSAEVGARTVAAPQPAAGVVVLDATDPATALDPAFPRRAAGAAASVGQTDILVVDLRWPAPGNRIAGPKWLTLFLDSARLGGAHVHRAYRGWRPSTPEPGQFGGQRWTVEPGSTYQPLGPSRSTLHDLYPALALDSLRTVRVTTVFVVNNASLRYHEEVLDLLQAQPNVAVLYERTGTILSAREQLYPDGIQVQLHTTALVSHDGALGMRPDLVRDDPITSAELPQLARLALARAAERAGVRRRSFTYRLPGAPAWPVASTPPSREERVAGLIGLWNVLSRFYPYMQYTSIDTTSFLREWIPRVEAAEGIPAYYHVMNEIIAKLGDAHARALHPASPLKGPYSIPAVAMVVQGRPVIVEVSPTTNPAEFPLRKGDEILAVDGKPVKEVEAFLVPITSAAQDVRGFLWAMSGPFRSKEQNSEIELTVTDGTGPRTVRLRRSVKGSETYDTTTVRRLEGGIGYISLRSAISEATAFQAMDEFERSGKGVILDMRGYPLSSAASAMIWRVLDRPFAFRGAGGGLPTAALDDRDQEWRGWAMASSPYLPDPAHQYRQPIVLLVDGRAGSQAESVAASLAAAANVTVVGAPTMGTNGAITTLSLPGGGIARFTEEHIVNPDGTRFHGVGVRPDVPVQPTVAGLRAGRDEVLEAGIRILQQKVRWAAP